MSDSDETLHVAQAWAQAQAVMRQAGWLDDQGRAHVQAPWRDEAHWRVLDCAPAWWLRLLVMEQAWRADSRGPLALRVDVWLSESSRQRPACAVGVLPTPAKATFAHLLQLWPRLMQGECLPLLAGAWRVQCHRGELADFLARGVASADTVWGPPQAVGAPNTATRQALAAQAKPSTRIVCLG